MISLVKPTARNGLSLHEIHSMLQLKQRSNNASAEFRERDDESIFDRSPATI